MRNLTGSITVSREFQPRFTRCSTVRPRYAFAEGDSRIRRRRWDCNGIGQDRARASALSRDRTGKKARLQAVSAAVLGILRTCRPQVCGVDRGRIGRQDRINETFLKTISGPLRANIDVLMDAGDSLDARCDK